MKILYGSRITRDGNYVITKTYAEHVKTVEDSLNNPKENPKKYARGIDIVPFGNNGAANIKCDILAHSDGTVIYAGNGVGGYGNFVLVRHEDNIVTGYAHLSSISVKKDQSVKASQKIGVIGNTGGSDGVHLHFEVRKYDKPITSTEFAQNIWQSFTWCDPTKYITEDLIEHKSEATAKPEATASTYTVKKGDTLWGIAEKLYGNGAKYKELMTLNGLKSDVINVGQVLKLTASSSTSEPTYLTYTVKKGDSLWAIAASTLGKGSRYNEIIKLNGLKSDVIEIGQVLKIPKK